MHHTIVALETVHMPMPAFSLQAPHTHTLITHTRTSPDELHARIAPATILINTLVRLDAVALSAAVSPHLGLVAIMGSGTDTVDLPACARRGITVTNCPHANVQTVAEHALGLYFAARRRTLLMHSLAVGALGDGTEWVRQGTLNPHMRVRGRAPLSCSDETLGVVGYGAIGKRIAQLASTLGMKVLVAARKGDPAPTTTTTTTSTTTAAPAAPAPAAPAPAGAAEPTRHPFTDVLRQATVLVLTLPRTPTTLNLLSDAEFALMRPEAVLLNVARGGIVDEAALLSALRRGAIAGAATDVLAQEPSRGGRGGGAADGDSADGSPLCRGSEDDEGGTRGLNLTITPHVAWFGEATMANYARLLKENVEGWVVGKPQDVVV